VKLVYPSGHWALSLKKGAKMHGKTRFLVDSNDTWDRFVEESIISKKKWNGQLGGLIGPQTSAFS
jgi:hypothetical protein